MKVSFYRRLFLSEDTQNLTKADWYTHILLYVSVIGSLKATYENQLSVLSQSIR